MRLFLEACASYNYIIHVLIVLRYNKFLIVVVVVVVRFRLLIWLCLFKEYLVGTLIYVVVLYTGKGLLNGEKVCIGGGGAYIRRFLVWMFGNMKLISFVKRYTLTLLIMWHTPCIILYIMKSG